MKLTDKLKAMLEECEKATPGPWYVYPIDGLADFVMCAVPAEEPGTNRTVCSIHDELSPKNPEFIANARTQLPAALKALIIAVEELDSLKNWQNRECTHHNTAEDALIEIGIHMTRYLCIALFFCSISMAGEFERLAVKFHAAAKRYTEVSSLNFDPVKRSEIRKIKIEFGIMSEGHEKAVAYCRQRQDENGLEGISIFVDEQKWNKYSDPFDHEQLMFHELGHCVLLQEHRANSIMAPNMMRTEEYLLHREQYLHELFNHRDS